MKASGPPLGSIIRHAIILAHREDTSTLEAALRAEGMEPVVQRRSYTAEEQTYSRTIRCLLNHRDAWRAAAARQGHTLVVEADFVPCRDFAALPAPFDPARHGPLAWAFLYAGGPRFIEFLPDGFVTGHASCPVALLVSPETARLLVEVADHMLDEAGDLRGYSLWDTAFQWHMMGRGARCFIPYRHYGEHGGLPNPEHSGAPTGLLVRVNRLLRVGLLANHHAECLQGALAFLPLYARGGRLRFLATRFLAKAVGLARLLSGRTVALEPGRPPRVRLRAYRFAFRRLLSPH